MKNLYTLDETLKLLNSNNEESINEGVILAALGTILFLPFACIIAIMIKFEISFKIDNKKRKMNQNEWKRILDNNRNITKSIINLAYAVQKSIILSIKKYKKYILKLNIDKSKISCYNFDKNKYNKDEQRLSINCISLDLAGIFDDKYDMSLDEYIQDQGMKLAIKIAEENGEFDENEIKSYEDKEEYIDKCGWSEWVGSYDDINLPKEIVPILNEAMNEFKIAVNNANDYIKSISNSKAINISIPLVDMSIREIMLEYDGIITANLNISFVNYSKIKLPNATKLAVEKEIVKLDKK